MSRQFGKSRQLHFHRSPFRFVVLVWTPHPALPLSPSLLEPPPHMASMLPWLLLGRGQYATGEARAAASPPRRRRWHSPTGSQRASHVGSMTTTAMTIAISPRSLLPCLYLPFRLYYRHRPYCPQRPRRLLRGVYENAASSE